MGLSGRARAGAVLLEVILGLVLFVAAAAVLGVALTASIEGVDRQRRQLHGLDLAVSTLSQVQLGLRGASGADAEPYKPPFEAWSSQLVMKSIEPEGGEASGLVQVEVVIRHRDFGVVQRLAQVIPSAQIASTRSANPATLESTPLKEGGGLR